MKSGKVLFFLFKFLVSGTLFFLLYQQTPLEKILSLFAGCNFPLLMLVFFILLANTTFSALKWRLLLMSDGVDIPLRKLVVSYLIGGFFNVFLPSNIGGDSYRIYDVAQKSRQTVKSVASVLADRLTGFFALVCLSLISALLAAPGMGNFMVVLLPLGLLLLLLAALYMVWKRKPVHWVLRITCLDRFPALVRIVEKFFATFSRYGSERGTVRRVMLISFIFQFLMILAVYLMALSLHIAVPFMYFGAFVPLITLMEALPISIYGIGVRDVGYVYFFGLAGMTDLETRSLALLFLAMTLCYSMIGGLLYLVRTLAPKKTADRVV
ncbi:MAG: lysylphosphatidylglycerol synthase transmembrane domain-containing protein [Desulfobulbaceae bacterium]|nr:lysylphosphatidylglycerol synthase transmembrane domain-containing protein [Desulfobulbaceae bacterium]